MNLKGSQMDELIFLHTAIILEGVIWKITTEFILYYNLTFFVTSLVKGLLQIFILMS